MVRDRDDRRDRRRAGSGKRDSTHRAGGDWTTLTIPDGLEVWQPKEGTYRLDIVPYEVGEGNPYAAPGEWYYERTFFTHRGVGANNESYVCPAKTAKRPCPICEYRSQLAKDPNGDEALIKALKPKERQLFLVAVHEKGSDERTVKLFESSFHTFGKLLDKRRQNAESDEPHITDFDDPEAGATLKVSFSEEDGGGYSFIDCDAIDFKSRPNGLDDELLDHGYCLDSIVSIKSYDELRRLLLQEDTGSEDDEPSPPKKQQPKKPESKSKPKDDDWDDEPSPPKKQQPKTNPAEEAGLEEGMQVRHRKFGECELLRISGDGTSLTVRDDEGEVHKAVAVEDVRPLKHKPSPAKSDQEDDDSPPPRKSTGAGSAAKTSGGAAATSRSKPKDDDWDDEPAPPKTKSKADKADDDWDDEPSPPKKQQPKNSTKPADDDDWD